MQDIEILLMNCVTLYMLMGKKIMYRLRHTLIIWLLGEKGCMDKI